MDAWVDKDASLKDALATMLQWDAGWVAVLEGDQFLGVLTPITLHEALRRSVSADDEGVELDEVTVASTGTRCAAADVRAWWLRPLFLQMVRADRSTVGGHPLFPGEQVDDRRQVVHREDLVETSPRATSVGGLGRQHLVEQGGQPRLGVVGPSRLALDPHLGLVGTRLGEPDRAAELADGLVLLAEPRVITDANVVCSAWVKAIASPNDLACAARSSACVATGLGDLGVHDPGRDDADERRRQRRRRRLPVEVDHAAATPQTARTTKVAATVTRTLRWILRLPDDISECYSSSSFGTRQARSSRSARNHNGHTRHRGHKAPHEPLPGRSMSSWSTN